MRPNPTHMSRWRSSALREVHSSESTPTLVDDDTDNDGASDEHPATPENDHNDAVHVVSPPHEDGGIDRAHPPDVQDKDDAPPSSEDEEEEGVSEVTQSPKRLVVKSLKGLGLISKPSPLTLSKRIWAPTVLIADADDDACFRRQSGIPLLLNATDSRDHPLSRLIMANQWRALNRIKALAHFDLSDPSGYLTRRPCGTYLMTMTDLQAKRMSYFPGHPIRAYMFSRVELHSIPKICIALLRPLVILPHVSANRPRLIRIWLLTNPSFPEELLILFGNPTNPLISRSHWADFTRIFCLPLPSLLHLLTLFTPDGNPILLHKTFLSYSSFSDFCVFHVIASLFIALQRARDILYLRTATSPG